MSTEKDSESDWRFSSQPYLEEIAQERKNRKQFVLQKGNFFKTERVAEFLDIEPEVVRDLIRRKELYAIKIGKSYRISEDDLQEFLNQRYTRNKKGDTEEE